MRKIVRRWAAALSNADWLRRAARRHEAPHPVGHEPRPSRTESGNQPVRVHACAVFYSFLRLHATFETVVMFGEAGVTLPGQPTATVLLNEKEPPQQSRISRSADGRHFELVIEAMVDREGFPGDGYVKFALGPLKSQLTLEWLMTLGFFQTGQTLSFPFQDLVAAWIAGHDGRRPSLLDIGGRARSGNKYSDEYSDCDVTTFDIVPSPEVDVVGDAHELSRHFAPESFDFAISISVFEHLVMPWKVAIEINKVLRPGGLMFIFSHQTIGLHEIPWDFYRFSDAGWTGLFNRATGFEIVQTLMSEPAYVVPRAWTGRYQGKENTAGFEASAVIVRKIGPTALSWEVQVPDILASRYPT